MATSKPVPRKARTETAQTSPAATGHRLPGMKLAPVPDADPQDALNALLGDLNASPKVATSKKSEKPLITLDGKAAELLDLQQSKAEYKTIEGHIAQLEAELIPEMEAHRHAINIAKQQYVGSIHVQATGEDADGNPIDAGQALYYVQDRYSAFNPFLKSPDDDLQNRYKGKATIKDEAAEAVMAKLGLDREAADEILKDRMDTENTISLKEGALQDPMVLKVLREHLAGHLVSTTKMTPNKGFHERSNFSERDMKVMEALQEIGLCKRSKAVIKASGAPEQ